METIQGNVKDQGSEALTLQDCTAAARRWRGRSGQQSARWQDRLHLRVDQVLAAGLLLLFGPLMALIALLVWRRDGAPILFGHYRIGQHGRLFRCLKFRSMYRDSDRMLRELLARDPAAREEWERDRKLRDDPRVTPIGNLLRRTSLDELPQLFNVLKGDMSLVGPRPPLPYEAAQYQPWHLRRVMTLKPGITGIWQVEGRSRVPFNEMVRMDLRYIRECSFLLDIKILAATLMVVVRGVGAD